MDRHRHQEWIKFLKLIDQQTPAIGLHLIVEISPKASKVKAWLKRHPSPSALCDFEFLAQHGRALVSRSDDKRFGVECSSSRRFAHTYMKKRKASY